MCKFLIFNTQKRYEKQKNFGSFSATFWQLLDTFIANFFGISLGFFFYRQLVAKPSHNYVGYDRFRDVQWPMFLPGGDRKGGIISLTCVVMTNRILEGYS